MYAGSGVSGRTCGPCATGYSGDGNVCNATDACKTSPCDVNAESCTDLPPPAGSDVNGRTCNGCKAGYFGSGEQCTSKAIVYICQATIRLYTTRLLGPN
jgi:hypothetical protein